ncbi:MAG TPA: MFS transporter, partial [Lacipirellulaceae bacterium]|nr:MFS transporter [Lacipirellulaceae bacterium]
MSWIAFFLCFFAWFGVAPLMPVVREELVLTKDQVGWCIIGSVSATLLARLLVGWLCDRFGPRISYSGLLILGSLPVMAIGLAHDFPTFLFFRVTIGVIGAAFVVTQYHTSRMFAANCVGTANAMTAGWGNLGGGVTQIAMPLLFAALVGTLGLTQAAGWRVAMLLAGGMCALVGVAYYFLTQDTPLGNYRELRATKRMPVVQAAGGSFAEACRDRRVWALFLTYAACFGVELTIDNIAAIYFLDYFDYFKQLDTTQALRMSGLIAATFGGMNLFMRAVGGWIGDRCGRYGGGGGRIKWLFLAVFGEGICLLLFSQATTLAFAIPLLIALA